MTDGDHGDGGQGGDPPPPDLVRRLALFTRLLRDAGLAGGPDRLLAAAAALTHIDLLSDLQVRDALAVTLVSRREDVPVFEAAFDLFWSRPDAHLGAGAIPGRPRPLPLEPETARAWADVLGLPSPQVPRRDEETRPTGSSGWSGEELLRQRDFAGLSWEETRQVRRLLQQSPWRLAERRTRRCVAARRGGSVDMRRTLRGLGRTQGEVLRLRRTAPRRDRRPLVVLCDVSGSMDSYSRALLVFAHSVARRERVETFAFSTRLTRVTHRLRRRDLDAALADTARGVHDLGGGTRIGDALAVFNRRFARRVLGHGAVVLLISDGWDRGDVALLEAELARLRRSCHRLIWLNPLLGDERYRPETRGMAAALPLVDDFLAANSVAALDELGRRLAALPRRRPPRR